MKHLWLPEDGISDAELHDSFTVPEKRGPKPKATCINGHEFTAENTRINGGRRICKKCAALRSAEFKRKKKEISK